MRGTYRFYQDGELIGKSKNLITDAGRRHIFRYLAGQEASLAGSIAIGAGTNEPAGTDTRLTYEFDRSTIYLVSPSYIDNKIIFKATLEREVIGKIYEVGTYSTSYASFSTGNPSRSLVSFDSQHESWSSGTFVSENARLGTQALRLSPAAAGTLAAALPDANLDLSGYANTDRIIIAFHCADINTSSVRLRFRMIDTASYFEASVTNPMQGYNVRSFLKSTFTKVGTPDWSDINSIEVSVSAKATGATSVDFDGIRVEAFRPDIENILISRSLLRTPVIKDTFEEMDIEYSIEVNF